MKITLCGSIAFIQDMLEHKAMLEKAGHTVFIPEFVAQDTEGNPMSQEEFYRVRKSGNMEPVWFEREKARAIREHFGKIEKSDAILVVNCDKNEIPGYIGGNTLIEMGLAFHLGKTIYILNPLPEISYKEELIGMKPVLFSETLLIS